MCQKKVSDFHAMARRRETWLEGRAFGHGGLPDVPQAREVDVVLVEEDDAFPAKEWRG